MVHFFDWQALDDQLVERSRQAIFQFATEYPNVTCSFFAYEANPIYGDFHMSFETYEHSLLEAQKNEQRAIARRTQMLSHERSWRSAKYFSTDPLVTDYSPSVGRFAHLMYAGFKVRELNDLSVSGQYPQGQKHQDDYIEGNVRIVLWKVIERLIANETFNQLTLASPFRVGYQYHDEALVVLRILNWPHP